MRKKLNVTVVLLLFLFLWLLLPQAVSAADEAVAPEGVYIENVNVSGMNAEQIQAVVDQKLQEYSDSRITFYVNGTPVTVTAGELGLQLTGSSLVDQALSYGTRGNILHRYIKERYMEENGRQILNLQLAPDRDTIVSVLQEKCSVLDTAPVDPTFSRGEDGSFTTSPGQDGFGVNVETSADMVYDYMTTGWNGGAGGITLQCDVIEYNNSGNYDLVQDVIGQGSTEFTPGATTRNTNLETAVNKLNGSVVLPGEEFSVCTKLAPFTEEAGYALAASYAEGEIIDSLGGGVCQVSTTLYQAVLKAELEITERNEHSMAVNYVPASMDAAIEEGTKDLKFRNNTDAAIYIEGTIDQDSGVISFTIYGHETRDAARAISFESKVTGATACTYKFVMDDNVGWGLVTLEVGHQGATAEAYKIVTVDGVEQSREMIASSEYNMSQNLVTIAMGGATNEQREIIENAVATGDYKTVQAALASCGIDADLTDSSQAFTADGQTVTANNPSAFLFTATDTSTIATTEGDAAAAGDTSVESADAEAAEEAPAEATDGAE